MSTKGWTVFTRGTTAAALVMIVAASLGLSCAHSVAEHILVAAFGAAALVAGVASIKWTTRPRPCGFDPLATVYMGLCFSVGMQFMNSVLGPCPESSSVAVQLIGQALMFGVLMAVILRILPPKSMPDEQTSPSSGEQ